MTITTKSALADELAISRARVSQYVKAGLPVRPDGKLDRAQALNWIAANNRALNTDDRGAGRAEKLARCARPVSPKPARALPASLPLSAEHDVARTALVLAYPLHARIVATSVLEAGGSIEIAYAAAKIAHSPTMEAYGLVLNYLGHPDATDEEPTLPLHGTPTIEPDWRALAEAGGLIFDPAACDRHRNACPVEASIEGPHTFETPFTLSDLATDHLEPTC